MEFQKVLSHTFVRWKSKDDMPLKNPPVRH